MASVTVAVIVPGASVAPSGRAPQVTVALSASASTDAPSTVSVYGVTPPRISHVTGFSVPAVHSARPAVNVSRSGRGARASVVTATFTVSETMLGCVT